MGEQERPGEQDAFKSGRVTDEADTEGQIFRPGRVDEGNDEPPSDGDTEGQLYRSGRATEDDDTEGHGTTIR